MSGLDAIFIHTVLILGDRPLRLAMQLTRLHLTLLEYPHDRIRQKRIVFVGARYKHVKDTKHWDRDPIYPRSDHIVTHLITQEVKREVNPVTSVPAIGTRPAPGSEFQSFRPSTPVLELFY
jgi:hypothetical protein